MSGYLLDTNVISELRRSPPHRNVLAWIEAISDASLFVSVLSLGEIRLGIESLAEPRKRAELERWLDVEVTRRFGHRVLPVSKDVAYVWGRLEAVTRRTGERLPTVDALLAATASVHDLTMVTRNERDFSRAHVPIVNPWT